MSESRGSIVPCLEKVAQARESFEEEGHISAFRLINGFLEGLPELVIDIYARTAIIHNYAVGPEAARESIREVTAFLQKQMPWLQAAILKKRNSKLQEEKKGKFLFGEKIDTRIREYGVLYAVNLSMNQDASFYLDTRNLRKWALDSLGGKTVLNTFAYTGSLGVAACAGGATRVIQMDLDRQFLNLGKTSYALNGFPINKADFFAEDFFTQVSRFKRAEERFDCVLLDPPFFSVTSKGKVDLEENMVRLINKVRPLINDGGRLVAVNNALYVSGKSYMEMLQQLCSDGYLKIAELIPVPEDCTGYPQTRVGQAITDPSPFNHSTKIAVLEVKRKPG